MAYEFRLRAAWSSCGTIILSVKYLLCVYILSAVTQSAAVTLTSSSLHQRQLACPGQQLTFTCLVPEGAHVIAWSSEEYIGERGVQIELTHGEGEGYAVNSSSHPTTVATLVKLKGEHIVKSTLSIVVSSHYAAATITCGNVGNNDSSISFRLLGIALYIILQYSGFCPKINSWPNHHVHSTHLPPLKANLPPLAVGHLIFFPSVNLRSNENNCMSPSC